MVKILFEKFGIYETSHNMWMGVAIAIIGIITTLGIMHGDSTLSTSQMRVMWSIPNYICSAYLLIMIVKHHDLSRQNGLLLISLFVYWAVYSFHSYTGGILSPLLMMLFFFVICSPKGAKLVAFHCFRLFLIIVAALGIIAYLSYLLSLSIPYSEVQYYSERINGVYLNYGFSYILREAISLRLCGLFAEPGEMGTFAALFLIADNYNLKKPGNIILFVAALFTFSLAFFLLSGIYLVLNIYHNKKAIISIALVVTIGAIIIPKLAEQDEMISTFLDRFTSIEKVTKRATDDFDVLYKRMFDNGDWLFGYGTGYTYGKDLDASGYKPQILQHGVVGFGTVYGFYLLSVLSIAKRNRRTMIFYIVYLFVVYKTGQIFLVGFMIALFGGFEYIIHSANSQKTVIAKNYEHSI